jgi:oxygen-independent coproporphyrinogen-3 oxidase
MNRFSLYIHIPYCQAKCPYCDFNSYAAERWPEEQYVGALCTEMRYYVRRAPWNGGAIGTTFFGGGTPSLFSPSSIAKILEAVSSLWAVADDAEVTIEANPGTVSVETLAGFRAAGVNRLSFGVQSFAPHHLRTLGRIHGSEEAAAAVPLARQAGFANVGVDLIFGLPGQTLEEWESDLQRACAQRPEHISAYNLTYEEGTPFHQWRAQGKLRPVPEEVEIAMLRRAQDILAAAGYRQYEISNYARPGYACRHNLNYWRSSQYLGVGAGAHSYAASSTWGARWSNERSPTGYMRAVETHGHGRGASETLDERQARGEFVFLGLRCLDGFPDAAFRDRFGAELAAVFPHAVDLREGGLLQCDRGQWRLTARGLLLADSVFATFL